MFIHYKRTNLEEFVEQLYIDHHITEPEHIAIENLSTQLEIYVQYAPVKSRAYESESGVRYMSIDNRKSPTKQRFDYLHELCHMLRHAGNQMVLPKPFVKFQEEDSEQFILYASMPYFMLEHLELSVEYSQAVHQISETFGVSPEMAKIRFDQILRREFEGELTSSFTKHKPLKGVIAEDEKHIKGTKIFAYYDPHSTSDGPDQLIVCLDDKTLTTSFEFIIPMNERFQEIELETLEEFDLESATRGDLICFDGQLTLQIHQLVHRYGFSRRNFVLQMRDVEQLVEADQRLLEKFF